MGIRSDIGLLTGRRGISPGTHNQASQRRPPLQVARMGVGGWAHPLGAHVHALVHRHVLDDGAEGERQGHVVRPAEAAFEDGAAV